MLTGSPGPLCLAILGDFQGKVWPPSERRVREAGQGPCPRPMLSTRPGPSVIPVPHPDGLARALPSQQAWVAAPGGRQRPHEQGLRWKAGGDPVLSTLSVAARHLCRHWITASPAHSACPGGIFIRDESPVPLEDPAAPAGAPSRAGRAWGLISRLPIPLPPQGLESGLWPGAPGPDQPPWACLPSAGSCALCAGPGDAEDTAAAAHGQGRPSWLCPRRRIWSLAPTSLSDFWAHSSFPSGHFPGPHIQEPLKEQGPGWSPSQGVRALMSPQAVAQGQGLVGSDPSPREVRQGHEATEGGGQRREHQGSAWAPWLPAGCPAATSPPGAVACGHAVSHPGPHPSQRQPVTHLAPGALSASRRTPGLHGRCHGKHAPVLEIQLYGGQVLQRLWALPPSPQTADSGCLCSPSSPSWGWRTKRTQVPPAAGLGRGREGMGSQGPWSPGGDGNSGPQDGEQQTSLAGHTDREQTPTGVGKAADPTDLVPLGQSDYHTDPALRPCVLVPAPAQTSGINSLGPGIPRAITPVSQGRTERAEAVPSVFGLCGTGWGQGSLGMNPQVREVQGGDSGTEADSSPSAGRCSGGPRGLCFHGHGWRRGLGVQGTCCGVLGACHSPLGFPSKLGGAKGSPSTCPRKSPPPWDRRGPFPRVCPERLSPTCL